MIAADVAAEVSRSFAAALSGSETADQADAALVDLGWYDLIGEAGRSGAVLGFAALGSTGATATLLDDVVLNALGLPPAVDRAVVLPRAASTEVPGRLGANGEVSVDGIVSARVGWAGEVIVPCASGNGIVAVGVDPALLGVDDSPVLDPVGSFRRVRTTVPAAPLQPAVPLRSAGVEDLGDRWLRAVADARLMLAVELVEASRRMLEFARGHAIDRTQFGRRVASFQAIRHRLAESLAAIEAASDVCTAAASADDRLLDAVAKSLAGGAARSTAVHAQQVLAGIGCTIEHPFHRTLKRVMVLDVLFGSAATIPAELGAELVRRREVPRLVDL